MGEEEEDPRWSELWPPGRTAITCAVTARPCDAPERMRVCERCGSPCCVHDTKPCAGCPVLVELRAACAGAPVSEFVRADRAGVEKTFSLVRSFGAESDVLFSPAVIVVRPMGDPRCHKYFAAAGPAVLARLLREVGAERLDAPIVGCAPPHEDGSFLRSMPAPASLLWFTPLARGVELRSRRVPAAGAPPQATAIPASGPWALAPAWTRPATAYGPAVHVDGAGVACPHCRREAPRYRAIDARFFVCDGCGRSFTSPELTARVAAR